jgi:pSer/pThr/pTyr-binding forkhead associated (FHA) protein
MSSIESVRGKTKSRDLHLSVHMPDGSERVVALAGDSVSVGKADKNMLVVDDPAVSSTHAIFRRAGPDWMVVDLGSRNGVYVNRHRISGSCILRLGDVVQIGQCHLVLRSKPPKEKRETDAAEKGKAKKLTVERRATYIKVSGALLAKIIGPAVTLLLGLLLSGGYFLSCGRAPSRSKVGELHATAAATARVGRPQRAPEPSGR